jgi:hypothetical protein
LFDTEWGPNTALRPESERLTQILSQIPGGVSKDELERLTKLVYIEPSDNLSDQLILIPPLLSDTYTIIGPDVAEIVAASGMIHEQWIDDYSSPVEEIPDNAYWEADSGSEVVEADKDCQIYIANILPSTIKGVFAYRSDEDGQDYLAPVPSSYYTKLESYNLGTIDVTALIFKRPLKAMAGLGWHDEVYVTLESSVGQNVTDVLAHIANTYTDKTPNAANFAAIKTKMTNYPVNFALLDRPNALQEMNRICWESRLGLYTVGDEFFLSYLSETPSSVATLTESDIISGSMQIKYTQTEQLATRLTVKYKKDYLPLKAGHEHPKVILRHNLKKYALHEREEMFHIYNQRELVLKSATFWLIRLANTWKKLEFKVSRTQMRLDTLDAITLNLALTHYSNSSILGVLEQVAYDSAAQEITLVFAGGVRSGEMEQYELFWPSDAGATVQFPTDAEIEEGYAGGYGPGSGVTGSIGCDTTS